jgi:hypothetical protein
MKFTFSAGFPDANSVEDRSNAPIRNTVLFPLFSVGAAHICEAAKKDDNSTNKTLVKQIFRIGDVPF